VHELVPAANTIVALVIRILMSEHIDWRRNRFRDGGRPCYSNQMRVCEL